MCKTFAFLALVITMAIPAAAAERKKEEPLKGGPTKVAIEKAENRAKYDKEHAVKVEHKGKQVEFVPCDIRDIGDRDREKGMILGRIINEKKSDDGLEPGDWLVFVRKHEGNWEAYFVTKHEAWAKSKQVKWMDGKEDHPSFEDHATAVRYWHLRVAW